MKLREKSRKEQCKWVTKETDRQEKTRTAEKSEVVDTGLSSWTRNIQQEEAQNILSLSLSLPLFFYYFSFNSSVVQFILAQCRPDLRALLYSLPRFCKEERRGERHWLNRETMTPNRRRRVCWFSVFAGSFSSVFANQGKTQHQQQWQQWRPPHTNRRPNRIRERERERELLFSLSHSDRLISQCSHRSNVKTGKQRKETQMGDPNTLFSTGDEEWIGF